MVKIRHYYSLDDKWFLDVAQSLKCKIANDKLIILPKHIGTGEMYFTEVLEGLSVFFMDVMYEKNIEAERFAGSDDLYILHYDLSEDLNVVTVDGVQHKTGYKNNLGFAILDSNTSNIFQPAKNCKIFALRLLVDKKFLNASLNTKEGKLSKLNQKLNSKGVYHFYDHIDSDSAILLNNLEKKKNSNASFDFYLKGIVIKLLSNFITIYSNVSPLSAKIRKDEIDQIKLTTDYMMHNLFNSFPGLTFLASMAGMSISKYKLTFKKIYLLPPNRFFIREKLYLGRRLIRSGNYSSVEQIVYRLNYIKVTHFNKKYLELFKISPTEDMLICCGIE